MTASPTELLALARAIDPRRAELAQRFAAELAPAGSAAHGRAVLLSAAYPALAARVEREPQRIPAPLASDRDQLAGRAAALDELEGSDFRRELRRFAEGERLRIILRELLTPAREGASIEESAAELTLLAEVTIEAALREAERTIFARQGRPLAPNGQASSLVVLGMGKLGGGELNGGSDVDLICFYDSDDRTTESGLSAHEAWTKVIQRMTESLEAATEDGFVWRVDHRLRPEGARGPLVNSIAAAERYYESFGRLWERAALLRARPVAGDLALGHHLLAVLTPFVWTRRVDPSIAAQMMSLVRRARAELSSGAERDLKLRPGGIREAEFFVQALQLIWGGREPRARARGTIEAADRLLHAGLVTQREHRELVDAYVLLRRAEHAVQWSTGIQTHDLPSDAEALDRLGRSLGLSGGDELRATLDEHSAKVASLFTSLLPEGAPDASRWQGALFALDRSDQDAFTTALGKAGMPDVDDAHDGELARDLFEIARLDPDGMLGARTRERHRPLVDALLDAVADAADPTQAARFLRGFESRVRPRAVYTKMLSDDPAAMRRLITVLGGTAFVGEAVARRPELADLVLFEHARPTPEAARAEALAALDGEVPEGEDPAEYRAGRLRRAQRRVTTQVALADLADDIDTRGATLVLSAFADGTLEVATRLALGTPPGEPPEGLAVLAMGKLGGQEIGYGLDLDVIFLFEPSRVDDPIKHYSRAARRIIQLITSAHVEGPGYELDTRLRPSGSQGMLVVSLDAFSRYHHLSEDDAGGTKAATWERLALLRARFAAGDPELGARAIEIARTAAYTTITDPDRLASDIHRLRERMEEELAKERPGRFDLKFGRGGLVDVEFAVQLLQLRHGAEASVRTTDTRAALAALDRLGALTPSQATALTHGYAYLRRLEQRLRVVHGDGSHLLEERAAGLVPLARRMGMRGEHAAHE
ncbi:MAG: bifunctional [glutamate--ammonia ligase]-adenylyl-L-tyrosine phosphorylase/[glutamate--ammonia-ligase] adenylyltransferase, partial [Myxococcales bacterium]|nr:bifunctional [glutamate--ammonia ligase]-adenylyl-L-tyrosine phosphorylase/[glutamate--ammonia-ligase] adenylyltransferase [Myxococcales bacterium]